MGFFTGSLSGLKSLLYSGSVPMDPRPSTAWVVPSVLVEVCRW